MAPRRDDEALLLTYVPLVAYGVLLCISAARLWVHRPQRCSGRAFGNEKTAFHIFLAVFAASRTAATALDIQTRAETLRLPVLVLNNLAACSYISLLLFLEMHWRVILRPLQSLQRRSLFVSWAFFIFVNLLLYAFVISTVWIEWSRLGGDVGSMWWSADVVDGLLVAIAVSYTWTALRMYLRVKDGLRKRVPAAAVLSDGTRHSLLSTTLDDGAAFTDSAGGGAENSNTFSSVLLGARRGVDLIKSGASRSLTALTAQSDQSRKQLRDALAVFIAIMLSSSTLLLVRATLAVIFNGGASNLWWWQVFVVWLPDVPPCCAYLLLMWPRDDDMLLAARSHSRMGQLFTRLLENADVADVIFIAPTESDSVETISGVGGYVPPDSDEEQEDSVSTAVRPADGAADTSLLPPAISALFAAVDGTMISVPTAPVQELIDSPLVGASIVTVSCVRVLLPPTIRSARAAALRREQRLTGDNDSNDLPQPMLRGTRQTRHTVRNSRFLRLGNDETAVGQTPFLRPIREESMSGSFSPPDSFRSSIVDASPLQLPEVVPQKFNERDFLLSPAAAAVTSPSVVRSLSLTKTTNSPARLGSARGIGDIAESAGFAAQTLPSAAVVSRSLGALRKWLDWEVYAVVSVGIVAEAATAAKSLSAAEDITRSAPRPAVWRYVGHTEPAYLEESAATTLDGDAGSDTAKPENRMSASALFIDGNVVLSTRADFLVAILVPHGVVTAATEAAAALNAATVEARTSAINAGSVPPVDVKYFARMRVQLRWYDEEDEDAQSKIGGTSERVESTRRGDRRNSRAASRSRALSSRASSRASSFAFDDEIDDVDDVGGGGSFGTMAARLYHSVNSTTAAPFREDLIGSSAAPRPSFSATAARATSSTSALSTSTAASDAEYVIVSWEADASTVISASGDGGASGPLSTAGANVVLHEGVLSPVVSSLGTPGSPTLAAVCLREAAGPSAAGSVLTVARAATSLCVERVLSLAHANNLLASPGSTTLDATLKAVERVAADEGDLEGDSSGGADDGGAEGADVELAPAMSPGTRVADSPQRSGAVKMTDGSGGVLTALAASVSAALAGTPDEPSASLPPSPRTMDVVGFAYPVHLELFDATSVRDSDAAAAARVRFSLTEACVESGYALAVPRALLPLILARRLGQLEHARASLEVFVRAMARGGQRGAWKRSQFRREEDANVRALSSGGSAMDDSDAVAASPRSPSVLAAPRGPHVSPAAALTSPRPPLSGTSPRSPRLQGRGGAIAGRASGGGDAADTRIGLSSLYGRLVSHIEREEEAKAGATWLIARTLRLVAYCGDAAVCLALVCGQPTTIPTKHALALTAAVAVTLQEATFVFSGNAGPERPLPKAAVLTPTGRISRSSSAAAWGAPSAAAPPASSTASTRVASFKSSSRKKDRFSRWLASNLHVQVLALSVNGAPCIGARRDTPPQRLATAAHSIVTLGAPAAHWSDFRNSAGLGIGMGQLSDALDAAASAGVSRRELAVNALFRDAEELRLSLRLRADAVALQTLSGALASWGGELQAALDDATSGPTAAAVRATRAHLLAVAASARAPLSGPDAASVQRKLPVKRAAALASASAAAGWARWAHANFSAGARALRSWTVPGGAARCARSAGAGFLIGWESLLSCAGKERGMLDDARVGISLLSTVRIICVDAGDVGATDAASLETNVSDAAGLLSHDPMRPRVLAGAIRAITSADFDTAHAALMSAISAASATGAPPAVSTAPSLPPNTPTGLVFFLPVVNLRASVRDGLLPRTLLPSSAAVLGGGARASAAGAVDAFPSVPFVPAFLSVGINEVASAAELVGSPSLKLQKTVNAAAFEALSAHARACTRSAAGDAAALTEWAARVRASLSRARALAAHSAADAPVVVLLPESEMGGDALLSDVEGYNSVHGDASIDATASGDRMGRAWHVMLRSIASARSRMSASATGGPLSSNAPAVASPVSDCRIVDWIAPVLSAGSAGDAADGRYANDDYVARHSEPAPTETFTAAEIAQRRSALESLALRIGAAARSGHPGAPPLELAWMIGALVGDANLDKDDGGCGDRASNGNDAEAAVDALASLPAAPPSNAATAIDGDTSSVVAALIAALRAAITRVDGDVFGVGLPPGTSAPDGAADVAANGAPASLESSAAAALRTFEDIVRLLRGGRLTSCKSAKDRTGMSVTLEESRLCTFFEAGVLGALSVSQARVAETGAAVGISTGVGAAAVVPGSAAHAAAAISAAEAALAAAVSVARSSATVSTIVRARDAWGPQSPLAVAGAAGPTLARIITGSNIGGAAGRLVAAVGGPLSMREPAEAVGADTLGMANFLREYGARIYNAEKNTGLCV